MTKDSPSVGKRILHGAGAIVGIGIGISFAVSDAADRGVERLKGRMPLRGDDARAGQIPANHVPPHGKVS